MRQTCYDPAVIALWRAYALDNDDVALAPLRDRLEELEDPRRRLVGLVGKLVAAPPATFDLRVAECGGRALRFCGPGPRHWPNPWDLIRVNPLNGPGDDYGRLLSIALTRSILLPCLNRLTGAADQALRHARLQRVLRVAEMYSCRLIALSERETYLPLYTPETGHQRCVGDYRYWGPGYWVNNADVPLGQFNPYREATRGMAKYHIANLLCFVTLAVRAGVWRTWREVAGRLLRFASLPQPAVAVGDVRRAGSYGVVREPMGLDEQTAMYTRMATLHNQACGVAQAFHTLYPDFWIPCGPPWSKPYA